VSGPEPAGLPTRARKDVEKYLLPQERAVVATRRHWAVLIEPTFKFLPVFLIGGWLLLLDPDNRLSSTAGLVVLIAALVYYGLRLGGCCSPLASSSARSPCCRCAGSPT
jgi:hypothetical protein